MPLDLSCEEIIFPRAQPQGEMFIENSMNRTSPYRVKNSLQHITN